jgi:hypothetical protein
VRLPLLILCLASAALAAPSVDLPTYSGARSLCSEHVTGNTMHISWTSVATKDDLAKVVAFYEKSLGKKAGTGDKGERTFEVDKDRNVAIYPVAKNDDFPHCATKPSKTEKTVILSSHAIR